MNKYKIRRVILLFLNKIFFHKKEYEKLPEWILWIFFPLNQYACKLSNVYIDYLNNTIRLFNIKIPLQVLDNISEYKCDYEVYYSFRKDKLGKLVVSEIILNKGKK